MKATFDSPQQTIPDIGSKVYTVHLLVRWTHENGHNVKATIRARQFNGVYENYCDIPGDTRWSIGKIGVPSEVGYGYSVKPEKVYLTRKAAGEAMTGLIDGLIQQLLDEKARVQA